MPQRPISPRFAGLMIALLLGFSESRGLALIFNSTGDATYNTTPPTGSLTNSGWQWQGRWKGATGTPIAPHFFITAGHLGGNVGDTFLFNGVNYVTTGKNASPSSDLIVWQVGGTFPSYAPLYTGSAEVGMNAVLFGRGVARGAAVNVAGLGEDALRGWQWMSTATAGTLRWGENTIESAQYFAPNDPFAANGQLLVMDFDRFNGSNSNEVTLGNFDSGGGLFIRDPVDNRWKLAGVNVDAEYAYRLTAGGATFNASIFDIGGLYYDEAGDVVGPVGADPFILGANGVTDTPSHLYSARISANIPWILGIPGFPPINTAPQISPVSNQTVDEGIPLMVTLTGSDADVPAQTLSYGLVSGPPGMTVTPGGVVSWTPNETQSGATVTVAVQATDSGVPSMSATRLFQVAVRDVPQLGRTVWQLGADAPTGSSGTVSSAEFSLENSINDPAPGRVTRLPGDPLYIDAASNPRADDDFYFGGVYPGGFNRMTSGLSVPNDEPFSAWERAHTLGDRTNRIHFLLGSVQAAGATQYRLRVDLATGGSRIGSVVQPGFSEHDYVVRFRNGAGVTTQVYSNRLTQVTNLLIDFSAAQVAATLGANSLEMVRVGPVTATDYWLIYDQVRLEVVAGNSAPQISPVSNQTVDEGIPLMVTLTGSDADVPAQTLSYGLVSGPPGMTVTSGGVVSWTPNETQGGATVTVTAQVTDSGVPPLSATRSFQVTVRDVPQLGRTVWQLGADAPTGSSGTVSSAEFSLENSINDPAPGRVTRLPGDPLYVDAASNPRADDDFYFGGVYPGGFNRLTSGLSVPNDEPFSAWERAHTLGDRTNRIHFLLGSVQAAGATQYRLRVDLATGGSRIGTVVQPGFSEHDYVVRFRNGAGVTTQVYSNRLTQVTNLQIDFSAAQVAATLGANSLEMVRVGPATATDYWLIYDQVRLEVVVGGLGLSRVASGETGAASAVHLTSPAPDGDSSVIHGRTLLDGAEYLTLTVARPEPAPVGGSHQVEVSEDLVHWRPIDVVILRDSVSEGWRTTVIRDPIPLGQTSQRFLRLRVGSGSISRAPSNE